MFNQYRNKKLSPNRRNFIKEKASLKLHWHRPCPSCQQSEAVLRIPVKTLWMDNKVFYMFASKGLTKKGEVKNKFYKISKRLSM